MSGKPTISVSKVVTLLISLTLLGCKKDVAIFDIVPAITLESVTTIRDVNDADSLIVIRIGYQDGDGNIGLSTSDTAPPFNYGSEYFHNLPVEYQVKDQSGEFKELINPNNMEPYGNQHERIPPLFEEGVSKPISGNITVKLDANPFGVDPQEVRFTIALYDRDLNKSNALTTDPLLLVH